MCVVLVSNPGFRTARPLCICALDHISFVVDAEVTKLVLKSRRDEIPLLVVQKGFAFSARSRLDAPVVIVIAMLAVERIRAHQQRAHRLDLGRI